MRLSRRASGEVYRQMKELHSSTFSGADVGAHHLSKSRDAEFFSWIFGCYDI